MQTVCGLFLVEELISLLFALVLNVPICMFQCSVLATDRSRMVQEHYSNPGFLVCYGGCILHHFPLSVMGVEKTTQQ